MPRVVLVEREVVGHSRSCVYSVLNLRRQFVGRRRLACRAHCVPWKSSRRSGCCSTVYSGVHPRVIWLRLRLPAQPADWFGWRQGQVHRAKLVRWFFAGASYYGTVVGKVGAVVKRQAGNCCAAWCVCATWPAVSTCPAGAQHVQPFDCFRQLAAAWCRQDGVSDFWELRI